MKRKWLRTLLIFLGVVLLFALWILLSGGTENYGNKYEGVDLATDVTGIGRRDTYTHYLESYGSLERPTEGAVVDVLGVSPSAGVEVRAMEDGTQAVYTDVNSVAEWKVTLPKAGLYNIMIDYLTVPSRGVDIERSLMINGKVPFAGADTMVFTRLWTDGGEVRKDNQGNDVRPSQVERFEPQSAYCRDAMGYVVEPYRFYFNEGENTVSLTAVNEPVIIRGISVMPILTESSYADYRAAQPEAEMSADAKNYIEIVQGEDSDLRSSTSLYARYDRSSAATRPYSVRNTILNYIGGTAWNLPGQWIEWEVEAPEDGFYNLTIKARQNYQRGGLSCRSLYIDGDIPFEEAKTLTFFYANQWNMMTLSDEEGTPYQFYLKKGTHRVRLETTLGEMGDILKEMEDSIYRLNQIYRKVLILTGVNPDRFRDYNIIGVYPEVIDAMELESKRLYNLVDRTVACTGQKSDRIAVAQTLAVQLEQFVENNDRITRSFTNFKDNITALGTAMQNMSQMRLDVDYIVLSGVDAKVQAESENFFDSAMHEIRSCLTSFFVDYNMLGDVYGSDDEVIDAWIMTGRDQSTILKTMIDDSFTPASGIKVNVKLVDPTALLGAVVAGNGPDIVVSTDTWNPVQYALRNAAVDLRRFSDCDAILENYNPSAYAALRLDEGLYGLPETQTYSVLFYRQDVLDELGLTVPNTWDELIAMLPTIQGNNLSVGIPYPDILAPNLAPYYSMLYQNGGAMYDERATKTLIDSESGVSAFELYTSLYNDYGLPTVFDFVSRFRSGEMPLGVFDYTTYNTLMVSAPEIRGLWDFTLIPGTARQDANGKTYIDHSVHSQGTSCMMIATEDEEMLNNCWEFMKWWVSTDSQVRFGREIESVLGSSARYATANMNAFRQLAWSAEQIETLSEQRKWTVGYREIAGGYYTNWHMTNAIRKVINDKTDARETLLNYTRTINEEIEKKRTEFGLPLE
ncbi:MAG: extracellular solute-binding protein [Eubacteriales bacterium]|nr:extracellular solute-binding protein [Eubacteriales bacterium]MDD3882672.1 extracellular solute-binding protein [Eubacteriales bacterium]MDD4512756.1 extracellular solute-binding protein [Eubacteriales bacterium]